MAHDRALWPIKPGSQIWPLISQSLRPPHRICYSAPTICSILPMMAPAPYWGTGAAHCVSMKAITQRKSNDATVNPHGGSSDERAIADT